MNRGRVIFWQFTLSLGIGAGAVGFAAAGGLPCGYSVDLAQQRCGFPFPDAVTQALGVSPDGSIVVGRWMDCFFLAYHAFTWRAGGGIETIPYPPSVTDMRAHDSNDRGQVVGVHTISGNGLGFLAFQYEAGRVINLGTMPRGTNSEAYAVNSLGTTVGWWGNTLVGNPATHAAIWQEGAIFDLGAQLQGPDNAATDVNDLGEVTGWMGDVSFYSDIHAFFWSADRLVAIPKLPGCYGCEGVAINNSGKVAGICYELDQRASVVIKRGFVWSNGRLTEIIGPPGHCFVDVRDINNGGWVMGGCGTVPDVCVPPGGDPRQQDGFRYVWKDGIMINFSDLIEPPQPMELSSLWAMSDTGVIVGSALAGPGSHAVRLTPPELRTADLDRDGAVDSADLGLLLSSWGICWEAPCLADLDCNGRIDGFDLAHLLGGWGPKSSS